MIKTIDELKELILWAKDQRVKSLKLGEVCVELSDLAFIDGLQSEVDMVPDKKLEQIIQKDLFEGQEDKKASDEDLFWSTR